MTSSLMSSLVTCLVLVLLAYDTVEQTDSERLDQLNGTLADMVRQSILQQLYIEEETRASGCSGVKQVRVAQDGGTRPYYAPSFADDAVFGIHVHANTIRTIGMGELVLVLNGVQFRTRHNDFGLVKPSTTTGDFRATEDIDFPPVPPEVLQQPTVEAQIQEMREWFKAWGDQNYTVRDYRPYFKPLMCYAEGFWTEDDEFVDEPYESTRHSVDATTWYDLEEQVRFNAYAGEKHSQENIAFLPKVVVGVNNDGTPQYAQWNYRILCHPLSFDLPLNRFRVVQDLKSQILAGKNKKNYAHQSTKARFQLNPQDNDVFEDTGTSNKLLEKIMREIPGLDNYQGNLTDDGYNGLVVDPITQEPMITSNYHSIYSVKLGNRVSSARYRGFSDHTVFMAQNTQPKVAGMENIRCETATGKFKCDSAERKYSYAIPLEIIYMTPTLSWNPYNIIYKGDADSELGQTVSSNGENGSKTSPYNGTNSRTFQQLPYGFFYDDPPSEDEEFPNGGFYVSNSAGDAVPTFPSGTPIFITKLIPGHDLRYRLRYPVGPVHGEGSAVWKELEALKDIVLKPQKFAFIFEDGESETSSGGDGGDVALELGPSTDASPHKHSVVLSNAQIETMRAGEFVTVTSTQANQHTHLLKLYYSESEGCASFILFQRCSSRLKCPDGHPKCLIVSDTA